MSKEHYDSQGHQIGWTDESGRHYDSQGHQTGRTDESGRHYDSQGHQTGWTDESGRHYDSQGHQIGWTKGGGHSASDKQPTKASPEERGGSPISLPNLESSGGLEGPLGFVALLALIGVGLALIALSVVLIPVAFAGSGIWVLTRSPEESIRSTTTKRVVGAALIGMGVVSGVVIINTGALNWSFQIFTGAVQIISWVLIAVFVFVSQILQTCIIGILILLPIWLPILIYALWKKR